MSPVCLAVQHRAAPSQLAMQDRSAAVKVGLILHPFSDLIKPVYSGPKLLTYMGY